MNLTLTLPFEANVSGVVQESFGRVCDQNVNLHLSIAVATNRRMSKPILRLLSEMAEFKTFVRDEIKKAIRSENTVGTLQKVPATYKLNGTLYLRPDGKHFEVQVNLHGHADTEEQLSAFVETLDINIF